MNWFNGDELDGQGCLIGVGLAFEPVLYSYQPEIEVGLSQRSYKSACLSDLLRYVIPTQALSLLSARLSILSSYKETGDPDESNAGTVQKMEGMVIVMPKYYAKLTGEVRTVAVARVMDGEESHGDDNDRAMLALGRLAQVFTMSKTRIRLFKMGYKRCKGL
ncbi:hypothetical protein M405DRAFT_848134 [Rhizopogon salebrosus TDB-379]|nr:hypothetical protein M405DRAFT_848134 [Rhizopogon salebrosus TDB-379]